LHELGTSICTALLDAAMGFDDVAARDDPNVLQRRMVGITIGVRHDEQGLHDRFGFGQERLSSSWPTSSWPTSLWR
jgi:hypothetical protein